MSQKEQKPNKGNLWDIGEVFDQRLSGLGFDSTLATEVRGFPIKFFRKNAHKAKPTIYLSAGIHGDEPAGPLAVIELIRSGLFEDFANWLICPILNPSGLMLGTRENHDGLDLNRNYINPTSLETKSHIAWLKKQGPIDLSISLHEDYESSGFYLYEINCNGCPSYAHAVLEAVRPIFPPEQESLIDDHEVREPGWIFHEPEADLPDQWPEAIWLTKNGTALSYTFETPSCAQIDNRVQAHVQATRRLVTEFCQS
ncbi:MAG: M14 family metallocarboxypeptidase [Verrucomicrobiota bacterium]